MRGDCAPEILVLISAWYGGMPSRVKPMWVERSRTSGRQFEQVALRWPEPEVGNLRSGNPEGALLGHHARRAFELPAPALTPKIGGHGKGGEDATDLHRHAVGIGCRLGILTAAARNQHRLFTEALHDSARCQCIQGVKRRGHE